MDTKYVTRLAARYYSQLTSFYSTLHVFVGLDSLHRKETVKPSDTSQPCLLPAPRAF